MKFEIKHRHTGAILFSPMADSQKEAVEAVVNVGASLRGADLNRANLREADLRRADLREAYLTWADLTGANLRGAYLIWADLTGADLTWADLKGVSLNGANLRGANLNGANLHGADLTGADLTGADLRDDKYAVPQLHEKILTALDQGGALDMSSWHMCETTHCRAGWAVVMAGEAGKELERSVGTATAGAIITISSCPWMTKVPDFYCSDAAALADIKKCAEGERNEN